MLVVDVPLKMTVLQVVGHGVAMAAVTARCSKSDASKRLLLVVFGEHVFTGNWSLFGRHCRWGCVSGGGVFPAPGWSSYID